MALFFEDSLKRLTPEERERVLRVVEVDMRDARPPTYEELAAAFPLEEIRDYRRYCDVVGAILDLSQWEYFGRLGAAQRIHLRRLVDLVHEYDRGAEADDSDRGKTY